MTHTKRNVSASQCKRYYDDIGSLEDADTLLAWEDVLVPWFQGC